MTPHASGRSTAQAYPRMWGIQIGRCQDKVTVSGLLDIVDDDEDDVTATTVDLTTLAGDESNLDSDDDNEDFAAENRPHPPPAKLLYNGEGEQIHLNQTTTDPESGVGWTMLGDMPTTSVR